MKLQQEKNLKPASSSTLNKCGEQISGIIIKSCIASRNVSEVSFSNKKLAVVETYHPYYPK